MVVVLIGNCSPLSASIGPTETMHFQTNLIMPEPTIFLDRKFPVCSIIRPTNTAGAAMGARDFLTAMGLFRGQSASFFATMKKLPMEAHAARHGGLGHSKHGSKRGHRHGSKPHG